MSTDLMLEAVSVSKEYSDGPALEDVSLRVAIGECLALVGESGAGKTTLLRMFNRMVDPDRGVVRREGRDLRSLDAVELRRRTGYVQQEGGLLPHWSVLRNAALVPTLLGMPDAAALAARALEQVGLSKAGLGHRRPSELSGGQRQRLAMARAIAARPPVLLLDEPFGALDAITRGEVRGLFRDLRGQLGLTAVIVTHDLTEALDLADRVAVLRSGRVEQIAEPAQLLERPNEGYVSQLLDRAGARSEVRS